MQKNTQKKEKIMQNLHQCNVIISDNSLIYLILFIRRIEFRIVSGVGYVDETSRKYRRSTGVRL